jgi:rhamnulokinase
MEEKTMAATATFLAADLGASNGRVLAADWDGERFHLEVVHRFPNEPVQALDHLHWDVLRLWREIKTGMMRFAAERGGAPTGVGIDTWGVDFALLDSSGHLLGNPVHYRDHRTDEVMDAVFEIIPREEIFAVTGLQYLQFNTLFQLYSMRHGGDPQLDYAARLLMMPDLLHYWMTGRQVAEYTIASTTQMLDARAKAWSPALLNKLNLPVDILPTIVEPGTVLGPLLPAVQAEIGFGEDVSVIAAGSHDTASAVAAIPGLDEKSVYISSGTWSLMGVEAPAPILDESVLANNFTNEGGVGGTIRLLTNISGLWMLQEARKEWMRAGREHSWEELSALGEQAEPFRSLVDPDHPSFLNPKSMIGAIQDYCRRTDQPIPESPGQVVRCCLESLALRYRSVFQVLETLTGHKLDVIRVVGGGSQNSLLNRFTADACQRPVVTGPIEATALGNVMVQAMATGHLASVAEGRAAIAASIRQQTFQPGPAGAWDEAYGTWKSKIKD